VPSGLSAVVVPSALSLNVQPHRLSRPGARCRDCSWSVSPGRSPNPACAFQRNGLSTVFAVRGCSGCAQGVGILLPRYSGLGISRMRVGSVAHNLRRVGVKDRRRPRRASWGDYHAD
jgi:hypothetical protein